MASLSGGDWWHANQRRYPNSSDIDDLEPGFRSSVEIFIGALRRAGAGIQVFSTRRNPIRAYLMHYSWRVAYGDIRPQDVPRRSGVEIEWDHGDLSESRSAAREMVDLFGMAHIASLTSNHITGKAIDMTIGWKGDLIITRGQRVLARIDSLPRTGAKNSELHQIGGAEFDVHKLVSDPPHWSYNGR